MRKLGWVGVISVAALISAGLFVVAPVSASGTTYYVDGSVASSGDGTIAHPYKTIQEAVNAAASGDSVSVAAGTYAEAVSVTKSLTIVGAGTTSTIIQAPASLPAEGAIVNFNGAGVNGDISGLTVEGPGPSACGSLMSGIFVSGGANANIHDLEVDHIRDNPLSGCQNGRAILIGWGHSNTIPNTTGSATVNNVTISDYQKAGIEVSGAGSSAAITNNTITGVGPTSAIAANGIEVTFGAVGNVTGNTVSGNSYNVSGDYATGILVYDAASNTVVGPNASITGNQIGLVTTDQSSLPNINITGVSGNTRNAVADTTSFSWTAPTTAYVDPSYTGTTNSDGSDIVANGAVFGYNAFTTIQNGVNALTGGGTVHVDAGTYSGDLTIPVANIDLEGTGNPVINLGSGYGINLDNPPMVPTGFTMKGFTVNASNATAYAFKAYKADNLTLTNDTFNGGAGNTGGGVDINTTNNVTFNNVTATGFHKNGFADTAAYKSTDTAGSGIVFNNVTSTNNGWTGISFYNVGNAGGAANITGVQFTGTNYFGGNGEGIFIEGDSDANHIAGNTPAYTVTSNGTTTLDLTHTAFGSDNALYDIENYQTAPVNAVGATFGGLTGNQMSLSQRSTEDGKIHDKLDSSVLGLVTYYLPPSLAITAPAADGDYATGTYDFTASYVDGVTTNLDWAIRTGTGCSTGTIAGNVDSHTDTSTFTGATFSAKLDTTGWPNGEYCFVVNDLHGNRVNRLFNVANGAPTVPTLSSPVNGTIEPTNNFWFSWNPSTEAGTSTITYEFHSTMNPAETNGVLTTGLWDSGTLATTTLHSTGAPDGTWYWQVRAMDSHGNASAWSDVWAVTLDTQPTAALTTCPAGTTAHLVETDTVNSTSTTPTTSTNSLANGGTYLLVASGTWNNGGFNFADPAYASVDNWSTYMAGYNIAPNLLGTNEFKLQVNGSFVNWGSYQPSHEYAMLATGTGSPVSFLIFDGDASGTSTAITPSFYADNTGTLAVSIYSCDAPTYVTTDAANGVGQTGATVNGTNGEFSASNTSFWWGTTAAGPFDAGKNATEFPASGWSHDGGLGSAAVRGQFNEALTGLTPGTTYYYVAWSDVGGEWYPGAVKSFTTSPIDYVTTDAATNIAQHDATLNGTNGDYAATGHSLWVSTSTFSTASANIPAGVYSTEDMGAIASGTPFSATLSSLTSDAVVTGGAHTTMPAIQPNTTYYYVAWSFVNGTWHAGAMQSFTTLCLNDDATLEALGVSEGSLSPSFDPSTTVYSVTLPYETTLPPTVSATTTDPLATEVITQATSTTGTATVAVTSQKGTTHDYTVNFSLAPATSSTLNVYVVVDNTAGGTATSSNFTVSMVASNPDPSSFPGSAAGTAVTLDPDTPFGVNISSKANYVEGLSGDCIDFPGIIAGGAADCTITETYVPNAPSQVIAVGSGIGGNNGGAPGVVLGASIGGNDALEAQIQALQQQLISLLEQYLSILNTQSH